MHTHNEITARAPRKTCFTVAADVERWPDILPHYREVRFRRRDGFGRGRVRMAAWRHFGPLPWPTWWESEMAADPSEPAIHYRHVAGITRGMRVVWHFEEAPGGTRIVILHHWRGPRWPLLGRFAARRVIGPHFVHAIADRTLAGVSRQAERLAAGRAAAREGAAPREMEERRAAAAAHAADGGEASGG